MHHSLCKNSGTCQTNQPFFLFLFFVWFQGGRPPTGGPHTQQPSIPDCRGPSPMRDAKHPYSRRCPAPGPKQAWELNPHTSLVCYSTRPHTPDRQKPAAPTKGCKKALDHTTTQPTPPPQPDTGAHQPSPNPFPTAPHTRPPSHPSCLAPQHPQASHPTHSLPDRWAGSLNQSLSRLRTAQ
jgi:hypothetical protein